MRTMISLGGSSQCSVRRLSIQCSIVRDEGVGVQPVSCVALLGWWRRSPPHHHLLKIFVK